MLRELEPVRHQANLLVPLGRRLRSCKDWRKLAERSVFPLGGALVGAIDDCLDLNFRERRGREHIRVALDHYRHSLARRMRPRQIDAEKRPAFSVNGALRRVQVFRNLAFANRSRSEAKRAAARVPQREYDAAPEPVVETAPAS